MAAAPDPMIPPARNLRSASTTAAAALALWAVSHVVPAIGSNDDYDGIGTSIAAEPDARWFAGDADDGERGITDIHGMVRTGIVTGDFSDLPAQSASFGPEFGFSVAMQDDWLVVGAPGTMWTDDLYGTAEHGAVFVFRKSGAEWQLSQRLLVRAGHGGARCGHAVALRAPHLAIGCPDRADADGVTTGYIALYKLDPDSGLFDSDHRLFGNFPDRCGTALALSRNFLAYGCPAAQDELGRVGVYRRDPASDRFTSFDGNRLPPEESPGMRFGAALAMYEPALIAVGPSDLRLAIGAPNAIYSGGIWPRGSVYLFHRDPDTEAWDHEITLRPAAPGTDDAQLASFGAALDMGWNQLVIGAPNNRAAPGDALPGPGTVHRFEYTRIVGSIYEWQAREHASAVNLPDGRHGGMRFGDAVAIGHDNLVAVAAPATEGTFGNGDPAPAVGLVEFRCTANGDWSVLNYAGEARPGPLSATARPSGRFGQSLDADAAQRRMAVGYPRSGSNLQIPGQPSRPRGAVWVYETDVIFDDGFQCGATSPGCD